MHLCIMKPNIYIYYYSIQNTNRMLIIYGMWYVLFSLDKCDYYYSRRERKKIKEMNGVVEQIGKASLCIFILWIHSLSCYLNGIETTLYTYVLCRMQMYIFVISIVIDIYVVCICFVIVIILSYHQWPTGYIDNRNEN